MTFADRLHRLRIERAGYYQWLGMSEEEAWHWVDDPRLGDYLDACLAARID